MIIRVIALYGFFLSRIAHSFILRNLQEYKRRSSSTPLLLRAVSIRPFQSGDTTAIQRLLKSDSSSFDPEGPLEVDCGTDTAIEESYLEDGCFLVASSRADDSHEIVGTAGLVIGTAVSYQSSGASRSTPAVTTGAVRRVCGATPAICRQLLEAVEAQCTTQPPPPSPDDDGVDELIALAYPDSTTLTRPTADMLERLGYVRSDSQLRGTDVVPYVKRMAPSFVDEEQEAATIRANPPESAEEFSIDGAVEALVAGVVVLLVVAFTSVPQFMGIDVFSGADNRGLGSPLTVEELNRLRQDERMQRTELDEGGKERQWLDLSPEEQKEELALMKVIQGQDIRVK